MKRLETTGLIIKKEKLASYETSVPFHELILEDLAPFPGYYDSFHVPPPEADLIPNHLFFVLRTFDFFNDAEFVRKTQRVRTTTGFDFDAAPGQLELFNEIHSCIRIRTGHLEWIPSMIESFKQEGIDFARYREVKPYQSLIRIKTYFSLKEVADGIYQHNYRPELNFLTIPYMPDWQTFEEITLLIRRNSGYQHYDAALASAYTHQGMMELVRIYDVSCTLDRLQDLQTRYHREIQRELNK
ncbi:MAG TPA: hypothetical protein PK711_08310 [Bacteroidales bacterium]|nr:hypothetical protein [Bacteroidales bacterium]